MDVVRYLIWIPANQGPLVCPAVYIYTIKAGKLVITGGDNSLVLLRMCCAFGRRFGRAAVAPYSFVDILTGTPQMSGSTHPFTNRYGDHPLSWPRLPLEGATLLCCPK